MTMRAIILAGGRGTRLAPYTTVIPKPLMPVGGMPILEILIRQLARDGVKHVTICLGHGGKIIKVYFADADLGVDINFTEEVEPLGTMGPLRLIGDLPDDFLVLNGDLLTDLSFASLFSRHCDARSLFSIGAFRREVVTDFGVLEIGEDGALTGFQEKPRLPYTVSMGIYAANRSIIDLIPAGEPFGFDQLVLKLLEIDRRPAVFPHEGLWLDLGRAEDFVTAQHIFEEKRESFL